MRMLSRTSSFLLLLLLPLVSWAFHCYEDTAIENSQEFVYEIPADRPLDNKAVWLNYQMNYQVFGRFNGNPSKAVIEAGLYTAEDNLVYSITIDCAGNSWKSDTVDKETLEVKEVYEGDLETGCAAGAEFDIWLKVHQPRMMSWIFNGQALQFDLRQRDPRPDRGLKVHNKYTPEDTAKFEVTTNGNGASLERFTFGKCVSWPDSLRTNCYEARKWVQHRSKMFGGYEDVVGKFHFGANNQMYAPVCYFDSVYYDFLQSYVHPDEESRPSKNYCCCVDMVTGVITKDGKGEDDCGISGKLGAAGCSRSCGHNAQKDLMQEAFIAYEEAIKAEEAAEKGH